GGAAGGTEGGAEDGGRAALAVADAARIEGRGRPPPVLAERVDLLFLDPQARLEEETVPRVGLSLHEPAVILVLAARHGDDDSPAPGRDAPELGERACFAAFALIARAVDAVVPADVLERRDAEREVERRVGEGELAHVTDDAPHAWELRGDEVDADELGDARGEEPREVGGPRIRRADVEDAPSAAEPGERPGDLDRALVELGRGLEEPRR